MENFQAEVYIVDDDPTMLESTAFVLQQVGLRSVTFTDPQKFLAMSAKPEIGCVLIDLSMPSMSGIELLRELRVRNFSKPVIVLTGCGSVTTAVAAMKLDVRVYRVLANCLVGFCMESQQVTDRLVHILARVL